MHRVVNGCFNREPYRDATVVQDGWEWHTVNGQFVRRPVTTVVPFRMEPTCQYTKTVLGQADPKCVGCKWRQQA